VRDYRGQSEQRPWHKALQAFAQSKLGGTMFLTVFPAIDKRLVPLTRGRLSMTFGGTDLLLHTVGARSGVERTVPLLATRKGDLLVIIASQAGRPTHPAWFHNLKANPEVEVTFDGRRRPMHARIVTGEERERLWKMACDHYSGYATYQQRAGDRVIPVVALEPC
jgi:deazaflavin-dependent oxidoreductase (nitroreductase family)